MSLKQNLELLRSIKQAGYKLVGSKSLNTGDGACWEATLAFGSKKLARVSNGGFGGPDETDYLATDKFPLDSIKDALASFVAMPAIQTLIKDELIRSESYELGFKSITQAEFDAKKAEILAKPVSLTDDAIQTAVQALADTSESLAQIKRKLKTHICFVAKGDDEAGQWSCVKAPDSPANRAVLQKRDDVDYFLADLVAGL